jgi:hypothetical protein
MSDHAIYNYIPHSRTKTKLEGNLDKPVMVAEQLPSGMPWPDSTRGSL